MQRRSKDWIDSTFSPFFSFFSALLSSWAPRVFWIGRTGNFSHPPPLITLITKWVFQWKTHLLETCSQRSWTATWIDVLRSSYWIIEGKAIICHVALDWIYVCTMERQRPIRNEQNNMVPFFFLNKNFIWVLSLRMSRVVFSRDIAHRITITFCRELKKGGGSVW
jgi:hypothetical protein